jgi:hypothetical protein
MRRGPAQDVRTEGSEAGAPPSCSRLRSTLALRGRSSAMPTSSSTSSRNPARCWVRPSRQFEFGVTDEPVAVFSRALSRAPLRPTRRQSPLHLLQHHALIRPSPTLASIGFGASKANQRDPAHVALRDVSGDADLAERGLYARVKQLRPASRRPASCRFPLVLPLPSPALQPLGPDPHVQRSSAGSAPRSSVLRALACSSGSESVPRRFSEKVPRG